MKAKKISTFIIFILILLVSIHRYMAIKSIPKQGNYHLSVHQGWSNDLQTIVKNDSGYYDIYFLHSIDGALNPFGDNGQDWTHTRTKDFIHYEKQSVALPSNGGDFKEGWKSAWTGSIIKSNTLFKSIPNDIYITYFSGINKLDDSQAIYASYSTDNGNTFSIPLNNGKPLLKSKNATNQTDFRDPYVFYWQNELRMLVAEGDELGLYRSINGEDWQSISKIKSNSFFKGRTWTGNNPIECPVIKTFSTTENGDKHVLFFGAKDLNMNETTGTYYIVGELTDDGQFLPESDVKRLDQGSDFYGANFSGSFSLDEPQESLITMGWIGNWNYFTKGVHNSEKTTSAFLDTLGSYSTARQLILNNDLNIEQTPIFNLEGNVTEHTDITINNPESLSNQLWVDRKDSNGNVYGLYDIPDQPASARYDLTFSSSTNDYTGRIYIDIWQGEDYIRFNYDPINGQYLVESYAKELENNIEKNNNSSDYYSLAYSNDSQFIPTQKFSITVITDSRSVEFFFPNGISYTVSRFSSSEQQDFKVFTEDSDEVKIFSLKITN